MVVLACGCSDQPTEYEPVKTLAQATVWTTECTTAGGTVLSKNVKAAPYNAQGNGSTDDTAAIQSAINAAKSTANGINGTCAVQVYFPAGTYVTSSGLYVPSRVSLKGYSPANSRILRLPGQAAGSIIELTAPQKAGTQAQCGGEQNIRIVGLTLEMRSSLSDTSKPIGSGGHCIRAAAGVQKLELRDLRLTSCNGYGIGLQTYVSSNGSINCETTGATQGAAPKAFEDITMKGIRVVRSGSDGIDIKQAAGVTNDRVDMHEICIQDVGWNDDGGSAAGVDLAGDTLWLDTHTHVGSAASYDTTGTTTYITGVRFRTGQRNVTNTVLENFYIKTIHHGIFFEGHDNADITLRNGIAREATTVGTAVGKGINVRGAHHRTEGQVFVGSLIPAPGSPDKRSLYIDPSATDIVMSLSPTAPTLPTNPACTIGD